MEKRGSHVGMVLSFTIFVIFLLFIYSVLNPAITEKKSKTLVLENLKMRLINEISANLTIAAIEGLGDCMKVSNANLSLGGGLDSLVKNGDEEILDSKSYGDYTLIESSDEDILWIYLSEEDFEHNYTGGLSCSEAKIISVASYEFAFGSKIKDLEANYDSAYNSLKDEMGVPLENEFGFIFEYPNGTTIDRSKNISTDIYAEDYVVQYVDSHADFHAGKIKIIVW